MTCHHVAHVGQATSHGTLRFAEVSYSFHYTVRTQLFLPGADYGRRLEIYIIKYAYSDCFPHS
jgi:hypothetical protein